MYNYICITFVYLVDDQDDLLEQLKKFLIGVICKITNIV